ncbi:putative DnaJ-like protein [Oryza sativa Japonica Group]|uniref:J domain-containing protein n=4 Tax=Oryza TaxID=4527 RepID=A0A0E0IKL5_ORYNI|nr:chaperone protein dnaJ 20, chloroplastic [Oryza sativa Japonica Group]EAY72168.1 hypothetical protein OsI_00017 [Oryza sativa Indica Group]KAF2947871.1 hypothetical protein DAI22_01g001300 [Oryza sativa Japonica Group]BAB62630.1 P0402A09.13 [Oryza sativa Japonica Group]BAB64243.1 putative DnaJ-like protein [Oryza sativa Japonica Group]BAB92132.1 P0455C04.7 [Oryza sativa Japonica Group]
MPHLAASPTSAAAAAPASARVAFLRPGRVPRPPLQTARGLRPDLGTLRTAEQPTLYDLLGISSEGTLDEVRAAYRRMARKYHPDVSPPDAAAENTRRFIEVQEAYETLSDPSRRATYDRALARGVCRLAFSSSRRVAPYYYQDQEDKSGWRRTWGDQIEELKRRSMTKDSEENLSWGARMRRRTETSSSE